MTKIGRNDPCPCGSGKKYKHCCLNRRGEPAADPTFQATPSASGGQPSFQGHERGSGTFEGTDLRDADDADREDEADSPDLTLIEHERAMWDLQRLLTSGLIPDDADPDAVLNDWLDRDAVPEVPFSTPLEEAQAIMYDAWAVPDPEEQLRMAHRAIEISADCADAYLLRAELEASSDEESRQWFAEAVAAGERALGPEILNDDAANLGGLISAWPYLRACVSYGIFLTEAAEYDDALAYLERVLTLDPYDFQGARFPLLNEYLRRGDHDSVRALLDRFADESSAIWDYARALLTFQEQGNSPQARESLGAALHANPYLALSLASVGMLSPVEQYSTDEHLERKLDGFYGASSQFEGWAATPGALEWLFECLEDRAEELPPDLQSALEDDSTDAAPDGAAVGDSRSAADSEQDDELAWPPIGDPRLSERAFATMHRLLEQQNFETPEEANLFLQRITGPGGMPDVEPKSELEQAQDLFYRALEAEGEERVALALRALEISPDCADAHVLLAEELATDVDEARRYYESGVAAGERALGAEAFREWAGSFWGVLETRPYMRARRGLAECLRLQGRFQEAIEHFSAMLRLNPGDNQGVRYDLLPLYLETGNLRAARRLVKQFDDDIMATWAYCRALLEFAEHGDTPRSRRALRKAMDTNPHVPRYLIGVRQMPTEIPMYIQPGEPSEAMDCVMGTFTAWWKIPGALKWIADALYEMEA